MTKEEAIENLKGCVCGYEVGKDGKPNGNVTADLTQETIDMAIKALEAPPNDNWEGYSKRLYKSAYERGKADTESTLDKARAEIEAYGSIWVEYSIPGHTDHDIELIVENVLKQAKEQVLKVIDKYKVESEDNA